jgi:hypothetical protein
MTTLTIRLPEDTTLRLKQLAAPWHWPRFCSQDRIYRRRTIGLSMANFAKSLSDSSTAAFSRVCLCRPGPRAARDLASQSNETRGEALWQNLE